tara:strand:- start:3827 stop:5044 length:1218 start_codon:yes stop_codon:yes gene_type:complete
MKQLENFGVLADVKVVYAAAALAGPFAAQFMADHGADVLWIERAGMPETMRTYSTRGLAIEAERRNQRTISLDIPSKEGRAILLKLIENADIFIESSKGGQYERWGLSDEILWAVNPRLVILHISGFGLTGDPDRIARPSYDPIAQAFGCMLQLNGFPDRPPISAQPYLADYLTGLFGCASALAALHRTGETGEGESIDLAQYEVVIRTGGAPLMDYLNEGVAPVREGARNSKFAGCGAFLCKDGEYVFITLAGNAVLNAGLVLVGLTVGSEGFPESAVAIPKGSPAGNRLDTALKKFCLARNVTDVDRIFSAASVPCSAVYTYQMAENDPHYAAREVFVEWQDVHGRTVRGSNIVPKFKRNPGRIQRGAPYVGMDNEAVLQELGYSAEDIDALYSSDVLTRDVG